ncbi:MAG UNVERIFIED_CONTAM: oligosaccharide flippase family protein [Anaerolineae bacterium]
MKRLCHFNADVFHHADGQFAFATFLFSAHHAGDVRYFGVLAPFTTLVTATFGLNFHNFLSRELVEMKHDSELLGSYLFTVHVMLLALGALGLLGLLFAPSRTWLVGLLGLSNIDPLYIVLAYVSGVLSGYALIVNVFFNFQKIYLWRATVTIIAFVLGNGIVIGILESSGDGVLAKLTGQIAIQVVVLVVLGYRYLLRFRLRLNFERWVRSLQDALPLVANDILWVFSSNGILFLMNLLLPLATIGQYSVAVTLSSPLLMFTSSFQVVWRPLFFQRMYTVLQKQPDQASFRRVENTQLTALIGLVVGLVVAQLFIRDVGQGFLNVQYAPALMLAVTLIPYLTLQAMQALFSSYLILYRVTYLLMVSNLCVFLLVFGANYLMIPLVGVQSVIFLQAFGQFLLCVIFVGILAVRYHIAFRYGTYIVLLILTANPLVFALGQQSIWGNWTVLVGKISYLLVACAVLVWLLPEKQTAWKQFKQLWQMATGRISSLRGVP